MLISMGNVPHHSGVVAGPVRWEGATRQFVADADEMALRLRGYDERTAGPVERNELPGSRVVIILELGPALRVDGLERAAGRGIEGGFVAGLCQRPTSTAHAGWQQGVQLNLRPTAASRLLGVPLEQLTNRVVPFEEMTDAALLAGRVRDAKDWSGRLDVVEQWLRTRLVDMTPVDRRIRWAESQLLVNRQLPIASLWRELGLSERHFIRLFTATVGITPKRYARLCRFDRICHQLRSPESMGMANLALEVGCYDQAHLHRETRALAGLTPTELRAALGGTSGAR